MCASFTYVKQDEYVTENMSEATRGWHDVYKLRYSHWFRHLYVTGDALYRLHLTPKAKG